MALRSTLSILGLWQFNNNIFSGLIVPEEMDKGVAIAEILSQCAELELVYPSYEVMEGLIANWSKIELPIWKRVYRDCTIEYNPIWNKDGTITEVEERDLYLDKEGEKVTTNVTNPMENTTTVDGNVNSTSNTNPIENSITNQTTGYNSGTWEDSEKSITDLGRVTTTVDSDEDTTTTTSIDEINTTIQENPDLHDRDHGTITRSRTERGNIGVTKTQEMLADDLALLPELNPYQFIVNSFKKRFCLLVY